MRMTDDFGADDHRALIGIGEPPRTAPGNHLHACALVSKWAVAQNAGSP